MDMYPPFDEDEFSKPGDPAVLTARVTGDNYQDLVSQAMEFGRQFYGPESELVIDSQTSPRVTGKIDGGGPFETTFKIRCVNPDVVLFDIPVVVTGQEPAEQHDD